MGEDDQVSLKYNHVIQVRRAFFNKKDKFSFRNNLLQEGVTTVTSYGLALAKTVRFPHELIPRALEIYSENIVSCGAEDNVSHLTFSLILQSTALYQCQFQVSIRHSHRRCSHISRTLAKRIPDELLSDLGCTQSVISSVIPKVQKTARKLLNVRCDNASVRNYSPRTRTIISDNAEEYIKIDRILYNLYGDLASVIRKSDRQVDHVSGDTIQEIQHRAIVECLLEFVESQTDDFIKAILVLNESDLKSTTTECLSSNQGAKQLDSAHRKFTGTASSSSSSLPSEVFQEQSIPDSSDSIFRDDMSSLMMPSRLSHPHNTHTNARITSSPAYIDDSCNDNWLQNTPSLNRSHQIEENRKRTSQLSNDWLFLNKSVESEQRKRVRSDTSFFNVNSQASSPFQSQQRNRSQEEQNAIDLFSNTRLLATSRLNASETPELIPPKTAGLPLLSSHVSAEQAKGFTFRVNTRNDGNDRVQFENKFMGVFSNQKETASEDFQRLTKDHKSFISFQKLKTKDNETMHPSLTRGVAMKCDNKRLAESEPISRGKTMKEAAVVWPNNTRHSETLHRLKILRDTAEADQSSKNNGQPTSAKETKAQTRAAALDSEPLNLFQTLIEANNASDDVVSHISASDPILPPPTEFF